MVPSVTSFYRSQTIYSSDKLAYKFWRYFASLFGEVTMVAMHMVTIIFSSSFLSSLFSPTFSTNILQLLLSFAVVLHSPPTLSTPLLTQSSHRILGLPRLLSPPLSGNLFSLPICHLPFFPHDQPISIYSSTISS